MKRIISLILLLLFVITSCSIPGQSVTTHKPEESITTTSPTDISNPDDKEPENPEDIHTYEAVVTNPTCTSEGFTTYTCTNCGNSYVDNIVAPLDHAYSSVVTSPDCENKGFTTYTCDDCGNSYIDNIVAALGHSYNSYVTPPTCNSEGYTTYSCNTCGDTYVSDRVGACGHQYSSVVIAPTCTTGGYTTYTCNACDYSYVDDIIDALGHDYKTIVTTPTCQNHGYTTYICTLCNDSYVGDNISSSGHGYTSVVTAPTCESEGYTTYTCSSCGDSYIANKVAALGHSYKSVITAPTCESDGYTTYSCSLCGDSYKSNHVSALGHNYKSTVTSPTCESEGYTTYTCSTCNDSYIGNKVSALGHEYSTNSTAPTCVNMGYTAYVCIRCDYAYVSDYVDALGHTFKDATTEAPKTCTTCGTTEGDKLPSSPSGPSAYSETLYVSYINVGQGDSIFIKVGDCDILIDAGTSNYGSTVTSYLKSQNVDDIELLINTHPDADHCGGLPAVFTSYVVEEVWISKDTNKSTTAYKNLTSAIKNEGLTAKKPNQGTVFTYEYLTLTVLYSEIGSDSNNSSIVIMLEYGNFRFLFTGDIGEEVETKLVNSGADLSCDVLKVGHHGSKYSSTTSFLNAVEAEYGVICVGSNSYGHPTSAALGRLSSAGVSVYRTDKNGDVKFATNGAILMLPDGSTDTTGSGAGLSAGSSSSGSSSGSSNVATTSNVFVGNTETKVFHLPTCANLPAASKQNTMYNYWWIVNIAGYTPCGRCLKDYAASSTTYIANATSKVYHLSSCSYLPSSSNRIYITSTAGYTPCGHCLG